MNKKIIIVFTLCLLLSLSYYTFRTEIEVEKIEAEYKIVNENFISKGSGQIILNGFKDSICDVEIIDNKVSFISNHKKYGDKIYYYDFNKDNFFYSEIDSTKKKVESKENFQNDLDILDEFKIKDINSKLLYKISDDNKKIIYINLENELISYNFKKNRFKIINYTNEIDNYLDFFDNYNISKENGYISIYNNKENDLSIFGADSGKLYGSKICGYDAIWITDCELILSYYDEKNKENKLGIYNVLNRKINYFYATANEIYKGKYYQNRMVNLFESNSDGDLVLTRYNRENDEFININIGKINISEIIDIKLYDEKLIVVKKDTENYILNIIDLKDNNVRRYSNVSMFLNDYLQVKNQFIILKSNGNYLKINDDDIKYLTTTDDELVELFDFVEGILIFNFKNDSEFYIKIIENS